MKKVDDFSAEETGEEWLRELYKVVAQRRGVMFRLIIESIRLLLLGNAGGAALVVGFMGSDSGNEAGIFHWLALLTVVVFGIGMLASALTMILVAWVSVKEAHGAENGLKRFIDGEIDRTRVLFTVEVQTFRLADAATAAGVVSAGGFLIGGLSSIALLTVFF